MDFWKELLSNQILLCGCTAWLCAQILKTIIYALMNRRVDFTRLFGDGGMPSGHSATVAAMAVRSGILYGVGSFEFAVTLMLAIIVMHDAMGVRLETGKQAKVILELSALMESLGKNVSGEEKLKELVGHTPLQVSAGAVLGAIIAFVW